MTESRTSIVINPDREKFTLSNFFERPSHIIGLFPFSSYLDVSYRDAFRVKWINDKLSIKGSTCYSLVRAGRVMACVFVSKNTWDSSHFSGSFYHLDMYSDEEVSKKCLVDLLLFSTKNTNEISAKPAHITCKIENGCQVLSEALLEAGFLSKGRQIILAAYQDRFSQFDFYGEIGRDQKIFEHEANNTDDLRALGEEIAFPSRLYSDAAYSHEKIRQMNGIWIEGISKLPLQDRTILLYRKGERNVGVAAARLVFSHGGLKVFGDAMFGFLPNEGRFIYDRLLTIGVGDSLKKCSVIECSVSETNKVFLKTLLKRGHERSREVEVLTLS